jgi:peptidoglycan/xylan/chitin deacetylase (PgdA/CDA1 family)
VCALALVLAGGASSGAATTTVVTLTFDNNTISQYSLGFTQALQPHGVAATFYVNSGTIGGSKNFLSWDQLTALAAAGNEIGGKTVDGKVNLKTTTDLQTKIDEVCNDRQALMQHGFSPTSFAYPFAAFDTTAEGIVHNCGYGNARAGGGVSPTGALYAETRPPKDYYATRPYGPSGQVTLANLKAVVNGAAAHTGGWDQVVIQKICSQAQDPTNYTTCTASSGWIELADLNSFLDWIQAAGQANGAPAGTTTQTTAAVMQSMDTVVPSTTIACNGAPCASSTYNGTVMVSFAPTDTGSGVASTHYTLDGTDPTLSSPTYTGPFPLTSSSTVKFRSWDYAGHVEATNTQSVQLVESPDSTAPTTTISCNGSACAPTNTGPVTVTLHAADNPGGWGLDKTYYTTDGSMPTTDSHVYTGPFTLKQDATVNFFSTDLAGNAETPQSQALKFRTIVSLTFDDGDENQYSIGYLHGLKPHGINGTFYIISNAVGTDGSMTWSQVGALDTGGQEIGGHTMNHVNLKTTTDYQTKVNEVCNNRQDLINRGFWPVSFAYPEGAYDATAEQIVQSCGFTTGRAAGGLDVNGTAAGPIYSETVPPKDPFATRTIFDDTAPAPTSLSHLEQSVTAASQNGGGWVTLVFHQICSQQYDPANYSTCMADYGPIDFPVFNQFLDWLQTNAPPNTTIETVGQVMHPGTPPPAPVITDQPAAVTGSTTGTFSFTDSQAGVNFQCMVDGIGSQCSSPFTSGTLADGSHTFTVKARDAAGNVSAGTSYTWTADTTSPPPPAFTGTHPNKLVTIVFENESHPSISGSADAPYMNQLIANGELFTNYFAVDTDGSFPNYLAMTSGNTAATALSQNIFGAIDASGGALTWKEYMESMPSNCGGGTSANVPGTADTLYTADHDPAQNFSPTVSCATNDIPLTTSTFDPAHLPDLSYIIPNECNDMHTLPTGGQACPAYYGSNTGTNVVNMGDKWLKHVVPQLLAQPNVTVLITFDEGGLDQGEHIATLLVGAGVTPGSTDTTLYDHYSLEAGMYKYFGLGVAPAMGATATPLPIPGLGGDVPSNPSGDTQPTIKFTDPDGSAAFQCSIDGAAFADCTSPHQTPVLSDGSHTFAVRSIDSVGNASAPTSYAWTVNTTPPTAPTIDTKPSDPSNDAQPSLGFSDSDSNVSFQCSIDGGSFSGCTSPFSIGPLVDGSHSFAVRSVNTLGTASAATTYMWTVDTTPPPAPALAGTPPANDTNISANFSFGDDEAGVTFECQLDAGSFSACNSPVNYSGLADGSHSFAVRARDAVGNPSSATSYTWSLQAPRPPAPSIDTTPSNPSNLKQAMFAFSDAVATVSFQCSLDGADYSACTSPFTTAALADGSHTFAVEAVDASNRTSNPTQYAWTIDTVAPSAPSITSKPAAVVASGSASFGFSDTEAGVAFECQLDGAAFASCTSPAGYGGLATGQHTFAVRARDTAGNAGAATSYSWRVDITPPAQPTGLSAGVTSRAVNLTWNANTETDLAGYNVYRSASASGPFTKLNSALLTTRSYQDATAPAVTTSFYQVRAVDQLGNASTPAQLSVKRGIAFRSATSAQVSLGSSITLAKPSGTVNGDVLVAAIDIAGTTTVTAPGGWTLVRSTASGSSLTQATYLHVAGTSEPSSYQWRFSSSRMASAVMAAYVGVNTTAPVDISGGGSSSDSSSDVAPSVTTTVAGDLLIGVFGEAANASVTPPTGMLEQVEQLAGTGNTRVLSELSDQQLGAAGATGARTAALSRSGANVGQLIALRPSQ